MVKYHKTNGQGEVKFEVTIPILDAQKTNLAELQELQQKAGEAIREIAKACHLTVFVKKSI
jgi:hypothetical protein